MAPFPQIYSQQRAPRVKLSGSVLALIQLEDQKRVRAKLHQLSINGGLLQLSEPLQEQAPVEVLFHVGSTTVRARAETIFPMWATHGYLQPFRFTDLREEERQSLETDLQRLLSKAELSLQPPVLEDDTLVAPSEELAELPTESAPTQMDSLDATPVMEGDAFPAVMEWHEEPALESEPEPAPIEAIQEQPVYEIEASPARLETVEDSSLESEATTSCETPTYENETISDPMPAEPPAYESEAISARVSEPFTDDAEIAPAAIEANGIDPPIEAESLTNQPSEVVLYFECPEDAFRFTAAASSVMSSDSQFTRDDLARLARDVARISRVTTQGVFKPAN